MKGEIARDIRVGLLVGAAALLVRLPIYLAGFPLWLDEALLAENLADPDRSAFEPPTNIQTVGPLYLLLGRSFVAVFGHGELALRLPSLLAGVLAVLVIWRIAVRVLPTAGATAAVALAVLSPLAIRYSSEVKPYTFDEFGAAVAILLVLRLAENPEWREWLIVVAVGLFLCGLSVPGILFTSGAMAGLLFAPKISIARRVAMSGGAVALWLLPFAVMYFLIFSQHDVDLRAAFSDNLGFGDHLYTSLRNAIAWVFVGPAADAAFPRGTVGVVGLLTVVGAVALALRARAQAAILTGPLLALAVANLAGQWPLIERTLLWTIPTFCAFLGAALGMVFARMPDRLPRWARAGVAGLFVLPSAYQFVVSASDRVPLDDVPAAISVLEDARARLEAAHPDSVLAPSLAYLPAHVERTCRYYSAGVPTRWRCEIPGYETVTGRNVPLPVSRERLEPWLDAQVDSIQKYFGDEGWLAISGDPFVQSETIRAILDSGFTEQERTEVTGIVVMRVTR